MTCPCFRCGKTLCCRILKVKCKKSWFPAMRACDNLKFLKKALEEAKSERVRKVNL